MALRALSRMVMGAAVVVFGFPSFARADEALPTLRLEFLRSSNVDGCGSAEDLRAKVAAQLGYDPFVSEAPGAVVVKTRRDQSEHEATISMHEADGRSGGERTLRSADCGDLMDGVALALALVLDPRARERTRRPPKRSAAATDLPRRSPSPTVVQPVEARVHPFTPPLPSRTQIDAEMLLGAHLSFATLPSPGAGFFAGGRVLSGSFALGLEVRTELRSVSQVDDLALAETAILAGALVPCYRSAWFSGCAVIVGGAIRSRGLDVVDARSASSGWAAAGLRTALVMPLHSILMVELRAEILGVLTETDLLVGSTAVWKSPRLAGALGLAPVVRFP